MTPVFYGMDGRSLATRVALLTALAGTSAGERTTLLRLTITGSPSPSAGMVIDTRLRVVDRVCSAGEMSVIVDELLTRELLDGRNVVFDLPGDALHEPSLAARPGIVRIVPVGPHVLDAHLATLPGIAAAASPRITEHVRFLSCGLAPGIPTDDNGRLGNAGRIPERAGTPWLNLGIPDLPARVWDAVLRGEPDPGVLALGRSLLGEIRGTASSAQPTYAGRPTEILAARLWGLAMDVQAYEHGHLPAETELSRAPLLEDWLHVLRPVPALAGRFTGHPYIGDGTRSFTSEVFSTDGITFARTLSRLYRLGAPAHSHSQ